MLVGTSLNTFVQASVPDEIRGRAMSFYLLGIMLGFPVGALLIGRVGDAVGFREVMVFNVIVFSVLTFLLTHVREYATDRPRRRRGPDTRPRRSGALTVHALRPCALNLSRSGH